MKQTNWKQLLVIALVFAAAYIVFTLIEGGSLIPGLSPAAPAQTDSGQNSGSTAQVNQVRPGEISVSDLPPEGRDTLALIKKGGPYPYSKDDTVFSNYEGLLPQKAKGYYHEYTVITPGSSDRGARRIVAGQGSEYYYTSDHYRSFRRIVE